MANFALDTNSSTGEIISSLNYALVNLGTNTTANTANALVANTTTGTITNNTSGQVISYLYQYINIRYSQSSDGTVNFSTSPVNANYYGLRNSATTTASSNPADYIWYQATGGFGYNNKLFYNTLGGYQISWNVGTTAPANYVQTQDGVAVDLAIITSAQGTTGANAVSGSVNPSAITFLQNQNGTYTPNVQTMTATFYSNVSQLHTANVNVNLNTLGQVSVTNLYVDPAITISTVNANTSSAVITFTYNNLNSASGTAQVQIYPTVTTANGISNISIQGNTVGTIATPPGISVLYPQGQYIIQGNTGYTPAAVANVVTLTSNVAATRGGNILAAITQNINYFTANGNYSITSNTATGFNANLLTFSTPYNTQYNAYQNVTYTDPGGTVNGFISVALIVNGSAGNVGPAGQRGYIPLAYIVTDANPLTANTAQLTAWFEAPRTNTVPPIGMGVGVPVANDTAQFFYPNVGNVYGGTTSVQTYDGTNWSPVTGQVVSGNVIYTGTITADRLSVNDIYTLALQSTNATFGNNSSLGFWMDSATGNARFGGNVNIGANLYVSGLITQGNLNNAVVSTNNIVDTAITTAKIANLAITTPLIANSAITNSQIAASTIQGAKIALNTITGSLIQAATVTGNLIAGSTITGNLISQNTITGNLISQNTITGNLIALNTITGNLIVPGTIYGNAIIANTLYGNAIIANTLQASSIVSGSITALQIATNSITANLMAANSVTTSSLVAGTITSDKLAANILIAGNIVSQGQTFGVNSGTGYWMAQNNGSAYFGGNLNIGNNLYVANLITSGNLNSNTVTGNTISYNTITYNNLNTSITSLLPYNYGTPVIPSTSYSFTNSGSYAYQVKSGAIIEYYATTLAYTNFSPTVAEALINSYFNVYYSFNTTYSGITGTVNLYLFLNSAAGGGYGNIQYQDASSIYYIGSAGPDGASFGQPGSFSGVVRQGRPEQISSGVNQMSYGNTTVIGLAIANSNGVGTISINNLVWQTTYP